MLWILHSVIFSFGVYLVLVIRVGGQTFGRMILSCAIVRLCSVLLGLVRLGYSLFLVVRLIFLCFLFFA